MPSAQRKSSCVTRLACLFELRDPAKAHGAVGHALRALGHGQRHSVNVTVGAVKCDKNVRHLRILRSIGLDEIYRLPNG